MFGNSGNFRWWVGRNLNSQVPKTPDLQSGTLPITRYLPIMVGRVGFEPTVFTTRVTDLQSAAFANYAYRPILYCKIYLVFNLYCYLECF